MSIVTIEVSEAAPMNVPINGQVYATKKCERLALETLGQTGWRKNAGSLTPEEVIYATLPGDVERGWISLDHYKIFWKGLRSLMRVSCRQFR
jgi:hypothetical protein